MKSPEDNRKQRIIYGLIIAAILSSFLYLGYYQVTTLRQDYSFQINSLTNDLSETREELSKRIGDNQQKLDALDSNITKIEGGINKMDQENNLRFKELSEASRQQGTRIEQLENTTVMYEAQIGKLHQQFSELVVESESFSLVIPEVIGSVVSVATNTGQGSGAIISPDGLVVTNYHVIKGAKRASVIAYNGKIYNVALVGYNVENDIALLKINSDEVFQYFRFGNSALLKTGQKVVALGNPAGLSFTATEGIISNPLRLSSDGYHYIQTDVTINPGNSGGPLINSRGEIVGIVNSKVSGYEGLGFAIPSNRADEVVDFILGSSK